MSKRVHWHAAEFHVIARELNRRNALITPREVATAQLALDPLRRVSNSALYSPSLRPGGRMYEALVSARDFVSAADEAAAAHRAKQAAVDKALHAPHHLDAASLEAVRRIVREEVRALLVEFWGEPSPNPPLPEVVVSTIPQLRPAVPRIDIVGLLPNQFNEVRASYPDSVPLRHLSAQDAERMTKFSPAVIVCSRFVSHRASHAVTGSDSRVVWANGGITSVINAVRTVLENQP